MSGLSPSRSTWQVEEVRPDLAVADVENILSSYNRQWHVANNKRSQSQVSIGSREFADVLLTEMHMAEIRGVRDESTLDVGDGAYVGVTHTFAGEVIVDSERQRLDESNVQIWSSRKPISFVAENRVGFVNVLLPEKCLHDRVPGFSGGYAVIGTDCPAGQLMASHMMAVSNAAKSHGDLDARCIAGAMADVIANLIRCSNLRVQPDRRLVQFAEIKVFIADNLKHPELSPKLIAQEFGFSLRSLHHLFSEQGESVMRYVKDQRLEGAARDLLDPVLSNLSVTEIGFKWAFSDSAHFSNAFKAKFGRSPSSYRKESLTLPTT